MGWGGGIVSMVKETVGLSKPQYGARETQLQRVDKWANFFFNTPVECVSANPTVELHWSALPAATIKLSEHRGWHELSAHVRKQDLILGWSASQSSGATKEHLRLPSTSAAWRLVGNGLYSRFRSSRHTPTLITHKGQGTERWPELGCKHGIWKEMNSHLKKKIESCRRRAGNRRTLGGRRVPGAEAEGPRGKGGSEMNAHYKYHPKKQTLGSRCWTSSKDCLLSLHLLVSLPAYYILLTAPI